ncbi:MULTISPECIES: outer membrane beta-barrel protein [Ignavibacterium]|jgi:hypothetical protein|uniref:outer membrane beta-barrel protein n=1 Tax=Ignavibacterium TaxID=795750 RepID=UPI0025B98860|nr:MULTISPECIES: outer membrane beta-barrel protein [Ignavibacterium]MBI5661264.1 hypothetical protein [Ignavibacterium album]
MFHSFVSTFISFLLFTSFLNFAQQSNSIQINGGIIMPMNSSKGLTGLVQYNYHLSSDVNLFVYTGYSAWDQFKVTFLEDYSEVQKQIKFQSYSADDHKLIPFYIGGRVNLHTNKLFTSFISVEAGYSYLTYNSYQNQKIVNPETGEVLGYTIDTFSKKEIKENLFGIGIGAGILHPISDKLNLVLSYKLNSYTASGYKGFFSTRGTYSQFLAGFGFMI